MKGLKITNNAIHIAMDENGIIYRMSGLNFEVWHTKEENINGKFIGKHIREFIEEIKSRNSTLLTPAFYGLVKGYITEKEYEEGINFYFDNCLPKKREEVKKDIPEKQEEVKKTKKKHKLFFR